MNKALHVFVYLFLVLTGVALYFEFELNAKRAEMKDRNRLQENYIVSFASKVETDKAGDAKPEPRRILIDRRELSADLDGHEVGDDEKEDILADVREYSPALEQDRDFLKWGESERSNLREVYVLDAEGKPEKDGSEPMTRGSGEDQQLKKLEDALDAQKDRFAKTRSALTAVREQLEKVAKEYNELPPQIRKAKKDIADLNDKITELNSANEKLEDEKKQLASQVEELNAELSSAKDDLTAAKDETEAVKEDLSKERELTTQLKKLVADLQNNNAGGVRTEAGAAVSSVPVGDKGRIVSADNEDMFAIVEFTDDAMKELKGEDRSRPLPLMTFFVRRAGYSGPAGEIIGSIRIRQEVAGKNYLICDILSDWSQTEIKPDDVVFAN